MIDNKETALLQSRIALVKNLFFFFELVTLGDVQRNVILVAKIHFWQIVKDQNWAVELQGLKICIYFSQNLKFNLFKILKYILLI